MSAPNACRFTRRDARPANRPADRAPTRTAAHDLYRAIAGRCATALIAAAMALGSLPAANAKEAQAAPVPLQQKYRRPASVPFPSDNPYSEAKAALGRTLFFDPRLSGPGTKACASCHNPGFAWKDGLPRGVGQDARALARATPTILDLAWGDLMMWDGRMDGLEEQSTGPITSDAEMSLPMPQLVGRLSALPGYRRMFAAAYGDDAVDPARIARAIATFERTVVSGKAPFDRWVEGEEAAISEPAKRGFALFNGKANCASCHSGWRFTDDGFHDIGLPSEDPGRGAQVPEEPSLMHAFKTPTLRNIDQRAPYMHDGSVASLPAVVRHYDNGFVRRASLSAEMRPLRLDDAEIADLVAFLHTLTSKDDPVAVPVLPAQEDQ
jgi:cytochrome c peroxidase